MGYNFISEAAYVNTSQLCKFDSTTGYEADFSENGNLDGWVYNDGIHTYGCWNNFLFATLYSSQPIIGRDDVFTAIEAEDYYYLQIAMKYTAVDREGAHTLPTTGKVRWRTVSDPTWNSDKELEFTMYPDGVWHSYVLNMAEAQWWQGDVFDIRIYPTIDGMADDEFFIRAIRVSSVETYQCRNFSCETYLSGNYSHPCPGVGLRGYAKSSIINEDYYSFEAEVDDSLIININDYGNEVVKLGTVEFATGSELTKVITESISKTDIGGYSEVEVEYTNFGEFIIHSGTYHEDSSVSIQYSQAAVTLGFYDSSGNALYTSDTGTTPADGFIPLSSFKIKKFQLYDLFDSDTDSSFIFNPFSYNIVGGRIDWFKSGTGVTSSKESDTVGGITDREFQVISNHGKTIIDFMHPFNASGRIKKIYVACTLDEDGISDRSKQESNREELQGAKVIIFRPKRDGTLEVITKLDIENRDRSSGQLYSVTQECVDIDCDIWVNKGDLIGVYNAEIYVGATIAGEVDALYYQVSGNPTGIIDPGSIRGDGGAGLLMYARSDEFQRKLVIDIDLENRVNVSQIRVAGTVDVPNLEFNVARCVDINWEIDLFGEEHITAYKRYSAAGIWKVVRPNHAFGEENLTDGVTIVPDGLAADSFEVTGNSYSMAPPVGTYGVVPTNPKYFFVNGDEEWLGIYLHATVDQYDQAVYGFDSDPIAFDLTFPYGKSKTIYKSKIYFKEKNNFRSFELSTFLGPGNNTGNSEFDTDYEKIPEYLSVTIDGVKYDEDAPNYDTLSKYLFRNPSVGHASMQWTSGPGVYGGEEAGTFDGLAYSRGGTITNNDVFSQAILVDWLTLEHEWEPIECRGFRFYTYHHKSTKICEFELYAAVEEVTTSMVGGVNIYYSDEGDMWYPATTTQENTTDNILATVGGMPRYYTIEIEPITETTLNSVEFSPKIEDMFLGDKGCEYTLLLDDCKKGVVNDSQKIDIKNVYGDKYDLYVDILGDEQATGGIALFTEMNNAASVSNPYIGPDGFYQKEDDYDLRNDNYNVAINCECYGLKNLIDGKTAYYSNDNTHLWNSFGTLTHGDDIDFTNEPLIVISQLGLPVLSRNRYWKLGFRCTENSMKLREIRLYYEGEEVDADFYHETTLGYIEGPATDTSPHVSNTSVVGSYYTISLDKHLVFDLGSQASVDQIVMYHDDLANVSPSYGIDTRSLFYLRGNDYIDLNYLEDYSYYEHEITAHGAGTRRVFNPDIVTKSLSEDFTTCSGVSTGIYLDTLGCVISGSTYDSGYPFSNAFDGDNSTSWITSSGIPNLCTASGSITASNENNPTQTAPMAIDGDTNTMLWIGSGNVSIMGWVKYDFGSGNEKIIRRVLLLCPSSGLNQFNVEGSNNDSDWDIITTENRVNNGSLQQFVFSNSSSYRYYRINLISSYGVNGGMIYELEMTEDIAGRFIDCTFPTKQHIRSYAIRASGDDSPISWEFKGFHGDHWDVLDEVTDYTGWASYGYDIGVSWDCDMKNYPTLSGVNSSASEYSVGYESIYLFDGDNTTFWEASSYNLPIIKYDFGAGNETIIDKYALLAGNGEPGRMPKSWQFQASNNDSTWVTLSEEVGEDSWEVDEFRDYSCINTTAYRYYRLYIVNGNHATVMRMYGFELGKFSDLGYDKYRLELLPPYAQTGDTTDIKYLQFYSAVSLSDYVDNDGYWYSRRTFDSYFDCVPASGTVTSGTYEYPGKIDFECSVANNCSDGFFKRFNFEEPFESNPFNKFWDFDLKFKIHFTDIVVPDPVEPGVASFSVGLVDPYHTIFSYVRGWWAEFFRGVQLAFTDDGYFVLVNQGGTYHSDNGYDIDTSSGFQLNTTYYCQLSSDGLACDTLDCGDITNTTFTAKVWTDDWDGSVLVADLSIEDTMYTSSNYGDWYAYHFGFGSGGGGDNYPSYPFDIFKGWISDIDFSATRYLPKTLYGNGSLQFDGSDGSYLEVAHENGPCCNIEQPSFKNIEDGGGDECDAYKVTGWIKFNSLPTEYGEEWTICEHATAHHTQSTTDVFTVYFRKSDTGEYQFCSSMGTVDWTPKLYEWYQFYVFGHRAYPGSGFGVYDEVNGSITTYNPATELSTSDQPMIIGKNFDGLIGEIHVSSDRLNGVNTRQTKVWERFYAMEVYVSDDGINYGHYCDIDPYYTTCINDTYSFEDNLYSSGYYSYLAIDLGKRHNIDLVRAYGQSGYHFVSMFENIKYSSSDVSEPEDVVWGSLPSSLLTSATNLCTGGAAAASNYESGYYPSEAFNELYGSYDYWRTQNDSSPEGGNWISYDFGEGNEKVINIIDLYQNQSFLNTAIEVEGYNNVNDGWVHIESIVNASQTYNNRSRHYFDNSIAYRYIRLRLPERRDDRDAIYNIRMYNGNDVFTTDYFRDARWLGVSLYNGDGVSRTLKKLGVYPRIQENITPEGGEYNTEWDSLGKYFTQYSDGYNRALGATVSGSSYFGEMYYENITNGVTDYGLENVWGSDGESSQWVIIDLERSYTIYRIKLYHGMLEGDSNYLITSYNIQTSENGVDYTTRFSITGNTSFERTHDIPDTVSARFIKINITGYTSWAVYVPDGLGTGLFKGATLREVQVFQYYGYTTADSEQYPIVAVDLNDQFYISSNEVEGTTVEDTTIDWSSDSQYFAYSDGVLGSPQKIYFDKWGIGSGYNKWVVIRRDTATNHQSGPDYMKHLIVKNNVKPNPCNYSWWWESTSSTISNVYDYVFGDQATRALKIEYPASTESDIVYFSEGDDFGIDSDASWRDGFYFKIYIDNIDNLDTDFGYFYFGGYDQTVSSNPVRHTWDISDLSLVSGWNTCFLRFREASRISYTQDEGSDVIDTRAVHRMVFKTIGMLFRGVGNPLTMYIDGFKVKRAHFEEQVVDDNYGLYLKGDDFYTCPLGDFDLTRGTVEFWFRPDYDLVGVNAYNEFSNRSLFHFANTNNDILGMFISRNGFQIYYGNLYDLKRVSASVLNNFGIDATYHLGLVYSNSGDIYDGSSLQLYLNGELITRAFDNWEVADHKFFRFILGGKGIAATKSTAGFSVSSFDAVAYGLKIYNYCKTDFSTIKDMSSYNDPNLVKPSDLIQISRDNLTFYNVGDPNLPFKFEMVDPDAVASVYVRTNMPADLKLDNKRTTGLSVQWDISV